MEAEQKLVAEYELCQKSTENLEAIIWKTSGAIGFGSLGSFIALIAKSSATSGSAGNVGWALVSLNVFLASLFFGLILIPAVWIWWKMAKRWWTIQHTTYTRMRHIEDRLKFFQKRYVDYKDYKNLSKKTQTNLLEELSPEQFAEIRFVLTDDEAKRISESETKIVIGRFQFDIDYVKESKCLVQKVISSEREKELKQTLRIAKAPGIQGVLRFFPCFITMWWSGFILLQLVLLYVPKWIIGMSCTQLCTVIVGLLLSAVIVIVGWCWGKHVRIAG